MPEGGSTDTLPLTTILSKSPRFTPHRDLPGIVVRRAPSETLQSPGGLDRTSVSSGALAFVSAWVYDPANVRSSVLVVGRRSPRANRRARRRVLAKRSRFDTTRMARLDHEEPVTTLHPDDLAAYLEKRLKG